MEYILEYIKNDIAGFFFFFNKPSRIFVSLFYLVFIIRVFFFLLGGEGGLKTGICTGPRGRTTMTGVEVGVDVSQAEKIWRECTAL